MRINIKALEQEGFDVYMHTDERDKVCEIGIQPKRWDTEFPQYLRNRCGLTADQVNAVASDVIEMQIFNAIKRTSYGE